MPIPMTPEAVQGIVYRTQGELEVIARACGVDAGDTRLHELLRSMMAGGYITSDGPGRYAPGRDLPPAPPPRPSVDRVASPRRPAPAAAAPVFQRMPPAGVPPVAAVGLAEVQEQIRQAYQRLASRPAAFVPLADIRDAIPTKDRGQVDRALENLVDGRTARVEPEPLGWRVGDRERQAAIRLGGEDCHSLQMQGSEPAEPPVAEPAAPPTPPPGLTDVQDRIAKVDVVEKLHPLAVAVRGIREAYESGADNAAVLLDRLLDVTDQAVMDVGYHRVGYSGQILPFDPTRHVLLGVQPKTPPEKVVIVDPGMTWTHRDTEHLISEAMVEPYNEEFGQHAFHPASDLEGNNLQRAVWLDANAPVKVPCYNPEDPGWYGVTDGWVCDGEGSEEVDCPNGPGCTDMVLAFYADGSTAHVPGDLVLLTMRDDD